jgi:putative transposase
VCLEILRRLTDANKFRPETEQLSIPSRSTIYREIQRRSPYEIMAVRYGKRRADMEFRVSGAGPDTSRTLQRVTMDHTPSDIIVVDEDSMLPLGRPTITSALDEYSRCPMGFYSGFEPPSCLSVPLKRLLVGIVILPEGEVANVVGTAVYYVIEALVWIWPMQKV